MPVSFPSVETLRDHDKLVQFLCDDEWPFHGRPRLTAGDVVAIDFASDDVASFWIVDHDDNVGLVRLLDLNDIGEGTPLFDLRIASRHRGRGYGAQATTWIVDHLFTKYPELHRIEADTRHDNAVMQGVLSNAGFTLEGRLRESWCSSDGRRFDTLIYGLLRTDPS